MGGLLLAANYLAARGRCSLFAAYSDAEIARRVITGRVQTFAERVNGPGIGPGVPFRYGSRVRERSPTSRRQ